MSELKLRYTGPATGWTQGLPIGNGRLGAVVFGGVEEEVWSLSESTFWSGRPETLEPPGNTKEQLERLRQSFFEGDLVGGDALAKRLLQPAKRNFGTNLPLGRVRLRFDPRGEDLERELDLESALASSAYRRDGALHVREILASHADGVIASSIRCERAGSVSFELSLDLEGAPECSASAGEGSIRFRTQALESMHSDGTCGVWAEGLIRVVAQGGAVLREGARLLVTNADRATIYLAVGTDYASTDGEWRRGLERTMERASAKGYERIKADHLADYRPLFERVRLELGDSGASALPTDERIRDLADGRSDDPQLFALFYQYGRYLTIAGSRADSPLPLNLQGLWNDGEANRMQWSCDYHLDINTQIRAERAAVRDRKQGFGKGLGRLREGSSGFGPRSLPRNLA